MLDQRHSFLWGAATSSHQVEGGNIHNDWWQWELAGNVDRKESSGNATGHWEKYREDLKLAAEIGLNAYRFSVEWSRIEPRENEWDEEALDKYLAIILECEANGLMPMVTLHHFTNPNWLAERGGLTAKDFPQVFARFVQKVVAKIGAHVPLWCTLNEPMVLSMGAYLANIMPPARFDLLAISKSCENLLRAHVFAYDIIHRQIKDRKGPWRELPLSVGIAHNMVDFRPARKWNLLELFLVSIYRRFYNRAWLDAITGKRQHFGVFGMIPYARQVKEARHRKTVDYLGINYYMKAYVSVAPARGFMVNENSSWTRIGFINLGLMFAREKDLTSDMGWAVFPRGLGRMFRFLRRFNLPIYVTENGIADASDKLRGDYLVSHLKQVASAIDKGIDIRGYFHWSLMDNFEWIKGFKMRFGLIAVDYKTLERKTRDSGYLYQRIIKAHGLHPPSVDTLNSVK